MQSSKRRKKNIPYLGPNLLFYCHDCSLPIIVSHKCPSCNKDIKNVQLTPPFDVRPATQEEVLEIKDLIESNFGENTKIIHKDDIVLLNHVGSEDQMEEIIFYGNSIGTRRYDLKSSKWQIKLNANGLSLLNTKITKRWVKVDGIAEEKISQGANVLIPGVIDADPEIVYGDYIAIVDNEFNVIAGGIARIDEKDRHNHVKGVYAKNYLSVNKEYKPKKNDFTWKDVIKLNKEELEKLENTAIEFINKIKNDLGLPVMISYSGGKDSLVTYALVNKALPDTDYKVLFVDTGIEFPETVKYVKESSKILGFQDKLIIEKVPPEVFWKAFEMFGPPGRDFRHCCKFAKLAPIKRAIDRLYQGEHCISFVGQRRYESFQRTGSDVWQNSYISNQINASPIQNWNSLMIWMYIMWKDLPYNPLYDTGYERIGCWACPSSDMAQLSILKKNHTDLYEKLYAAVDKWKEEKGLSEDYWRYGLWRFKNIPRKIISALSLNQSDIKPISPKNELIALQIEASDCITMPLSIIGNFSNRIDLQKISSSLIMVGRVQLNQKLNFLRVFNKRYSTIIYSDGTFKINFRKQKNLTELDVRKAIENFVYTVLRALECINCELCVGKCEVGAITIQDSIIYVDKKKCIKCNQCSEICPIVTIVHRELKDKIKNTVKDSELRQFLT
ncbi:MAG: phosphoadenosine phosphosulfate reductase family protein [Candidatus Heimdallarchaeota archaeon]|nr:phosphoadenosine phosphosulfate reductase family protein [Candidatus Heimdallarchaeota archaeon]